MAVDATQLIIITARLETITETLTHQLQKLSDLVTKNTERQTELLDELRRDVDIHSKHSKQDIQQNRSDIDDLIERLAVMEAEISQISAWQRAHDNYVCPFITPTSTAMTKTALHRLMDKHFSREDVNSILFDLGFEEENIPGETKSAVIRNVINEVEHRDLLERLVAICNKLRPEVQWPILI